MWYVDWLSKLTPFFYQIMNYKNELNQALQKSKFKSLKGLYEHNRFSFSYEYLRQIFLGLKVPSDKKLEEISKPLGLDNKKLHKLAIESRLDRSFLKYFHKASDKELGKKKKNLNSKNKKDEKIITLLFSLNNKQKDQVINYIKSLA